MCETAISADVCASLTALKMLRPKAGWMKPVMLLKATALQLPCSLSKHPRVQFFEAEGEHTFGALPPASVMLLFSSLWQPLFIRIWPFVPMNDATAVSRGRTRAVLALSRLEHLWSGKLHIVGNCWLTFNSVFAVVCWKIGNDGCTYLDAHWGSANS